MFVKTLTNLVNGIKSNMTMKTFVIIAILLGIAMYVNNMTQSKVRPAERMEGGVEAPAEEKAEESAAPAPAGGSAGYSAATVANPKDLLPSDENSQWAALNPNAANGSEIAMPDLLTAGQHIGVDSIGQTLRNANLQLRSDPTIAKVDVGPWNQSTMEGDPSRVPLELGTAK